MTIIHSLPQITTRILTMPDTLKDSLVDAITAPARPAVDRPAKALKLVDTFTTAGCRPGLALVLSATTDKLTGERKSYELNFCQQSTVHADILRVLRCGCQGFYSSGRCRHSDKLAFCLNLPAVLRAFTGSARAEVGEAHEMYPCGNCAMLYGENCTVYRVHYYAGPGGYQTEIQCPNCLTSGGLR